MEKKLFGVVIKVENLEMTRSFYRDILKLGDPVMDSNFWVEFRLPGDFSLFLEKKEEGDKVPESIGRTSWIYKVKSVDDVISRLKEYGYETFSAPEEEQRAGFKTYVFCDPEGNPFHLCSED